MHLRRDMAMRNVITFKLTSSQLEELKNEIRKTGGSKVGNSVIFSDNSGASLLAKGGEIKIRNGKVVRRYNSRKGIVRFAISIVYSKFLANDISESSLSLADSLELETIALNEWEKSNKTLLKVG